MNVSVEIIDDIVRQVMDQLRSTPPAQEPSKASAPVESKPTAPAVVAAPAERLILSESVITGGMLEERWSRERTIVIPPKAVLTPTAVEFLRKQQLQCERSRPATGKDGTVATTWLILRSAASADQDRLLEEISRTFPTVRIQITGCAVECRKTAVTELSRASVPGIVALVKDPWKVACLANRQPRVRGAVVEQLADWEAIHQQLSPNLVCIGPVGKAPYALRHLLSAILKSGAPVAPTGWRD